MRSKNISCHRRNNSACNVLHRKRLLKSFWLITVIRSLLSRNTTIIVNTTTCDDTMLCAGPAGRAERSPQPCPTQADGSTFCFKAKKVTTGNQEKKTNKNSFSE